MLQTEKVDTLRNNQNTYSLQKPAEVSRLRSLRRVDVLAKVRRRPFQIQSTTLLLGMVCLLRRLLCSQRHAEAEVAACLRKSLRKMAPHLQSV